MFIHLSKTFQLVSSCSDHGCTPLKMCAKVKDSLCFLDRENIHKTILFPLLCAFGCASLKAPHYATVIAYL
jgi:hypothetical protein